MGHAATLERSAKMTITQILNNYSDSDGDFLLSIYLEKHNPSPEDYCALVNKLSLKCAEEFSNKIISFEQADDFMNEIYSFMISDDFLDASDNTLSSPAYEIYDAFDAGEYSRKEDGDEVDPVKKYTIPAIEEILRNQRAEQGRAHQSTTAS